MDESDRRLAYAEARLPRYTSYPTALHFGPLDAATWRGWLARTTAADSLSLYVHIPFCRALCWYCGCHTSVTRSAARLLRYASGLEREAALAAEAIPQSAGVAHLHLGGGSPDALGAAALHRLLAALRRCFRFQDQAEIAAELDPRNLDAATVAALAEGGLNRASLGVQDIAPEVQALIGRTQPAAQVAAATRRLRAAGIAAINLDLMYGLPGQTVAHAASSARFAVEQGAARIAAFGYAHVPWMRPHQKAIATARLPDAAERLRQADAIAETLQGAGYVAIGLDHFALPGDALAVAARSGRLRRNFQGYTTDQAPVLVPLGASAIGRTPAGFAQNEPDERRWLAAVEAGTLPIARGLALTPEDRERAALIETVMCQGVIDRDAVPRPILDAAMPRLGRLIADGMLVEDGSLLRATDAGRTLLRHIAACFDARLPLDAGRHSVAA